MSARRYVPEPERPVRGFLIACVMVPGIGADGGPGRGYFFANIAGGPRSTPHYRQGETYGTPGLGFWSQEPDSFRYASLEFDTAPDEAGTHYWVGLQQMIPKLLREDPNLRAELIKMIEMPDGIPLPPSHAVDDDWDDDDDDEYGFEA